MSKVKSAGGFLHFEIDGKEYELKVKKGNSKPLPAFIYIMTMQAAYWCICGYLGLCKFHRLALGICYGLGWELSKHSGPVTLERREKDEECIDALVNNKLAHLLAEGLLQMSKRARLHKMKFVRWNETGDMKSLEHFIFVDEVSDYLYKKEGIVTTIYTHRSDLWEIFKDIRKSEGLRVMGSGFMADGMFIDDDSFEEYLKEHPEINKEECGRCSSHCVNCFEQFGVGPCYDIKRNKETKIEENIWIEKLRK